MNLFFSSPLPPARSYDSLLANLWSYSPRGGSGFANQYSPLQWLAHWQYLFCMCIKSSSMWCFLVGSGYVEQHHTFNTLPFFKFTWIHQSLKILQALPMEGLSKPQLHPLFKSVQKYGLAVAQTDAAKFKSNLEKALVAVFLCASFKQTSC